MKSCRKGVNIFVEIIDNMLQAGKIFLLYFGGLKRGVLY